MKGQVDKSTSSEGMRYAQYQLMEEGFVVSRPEQQQVSAYPTASRDKGKERCSLQPLVGDTVCTHKRTTVFSGAGCGAWHPIWLLVTGLCVHVPWRTGQTCSGSNRVRHSLIPNRHNC